MASLVDLVAAELDQPVLPEVSRLAERLAERHGGAAEAVLFYGSCLWSQQTDGLMLDFYLLVDDYRHAYDRRWLAVANRLVPPNVFYVEADGLRAKYAVLTLDHFARLASAATRNVSVWARFAQPSALVWSRDARARTRTLEAVARAPAALLAAARPVLPDQMTISGLWTGAFALTYEAELRAERQGRGITLFDTAPERYRAMTAPALAAAGLTAEIHGDVISFSDGADRAAGLRAWQRRRIEGKLWSVIRLVKAVFTFDGGIDYLAWKIARHSGVVIEITPWQRKHPILAGLTLLPILRKSGAVR